MGRHAWQNNSRRGAAALTNAKIAVSTYHYDPQRTGGNNQETALTESSFPSTFASIATVTLDDQVDDPATDMIPPNQTIMVNGISSCASADGRFVFSRRRPALALVL